MPVKDPITQESVNGSRIVVPSYSRVRVNGARMPNTLTKEDISALARMSNFNPIAQGRIGYDPYQRYSQLENPQFYANQDHAQYASENQSWGQQAINAVVGGTLSGTLGAIEAISYIPNIFSRSWAKNGVSQAISDARDDIKSEYEVYTDPNNPLSWDTSMLFSGMQGVIDSGLEFGLPGMGISKLFSVVGKAISLAGRGLAQVATRGVGKAAQIAGAEVAGMSAEVAGSNVLGRLASNTWVGQAGKTITGELAIQNPAVRNSLIQWAKHTPSGIAMNQLEGTVMGMDMYKQRYQEFRDLGYSHAQANKMAEEEATKLRNQNSWLMLKDIWMMKSLFSSFGKDELVKPFSLNPITGLKGIARGLKRDGFIKGTAGGRNLIAQGLGEDAEEMIQGGIQGNIEDQTNKKINEELGYKALEETPYSGLRGVLHHATTDQSVFEGMMGFFGGGFQSVIMAAPAKMYDNAKYNRLQKEIKILDDRIAVEKDPSKLKEYKIEKKVKERESYNTQKGRYVDQQARIEQNKNELSNDLVKMAENIEVQNNIIDNQDKISEEAFGKNTFLQMAVDNFERGTGESLRATLQDIQEGDKRIFGKDVTDEEKDKAASLLEEFDRLQKDYIKYKSSPKSLLASERLKIFSTANKQGLEKLNTIRESIQSDLDVINETAKIIDPEHKEITVDDVISDKELKSENPKIQPVLDQAKQLKELHEYDKTKDLVDTASEGVTKFSNQLSLYNNKRYQKAEAQIQENIEKNYKIDISNPDVVDNFENSFEQIIKDIDGDNGIPEYGKIDLKERINNVVGKYSEHVDLSKKINKEKEDYEKYLLELEDLKKSIENNPYYSFNSNHGSIDVIIIKDGENYYFELASGVIIKEFPSLNEEGEEVNSPITIEMIHHFIEEGAIEEGSKESFDRSSEYFYQDSMDEDKIKAYEEFIFSEESESDEAQNFVNDLFDNPQELKQYTAEVIARRPTDAEKIIAFHNRVVQQMGGEPLTEEEVEKIIMKAKARRKRRSKKSSVIENESLEVLSDKIQELKETRLGIKNRISEIDNSIKKSEEILTIARNEAWGRINQIEKKIYDLEKLYSGKRANKRLNATKKRAEEERTKLKKEISFELESLQEIQDNLRVLKEERRLLADAYSDISNHILYFKNLKATPDFDLNQVLSRIIKLESNKDELDLVIKSIESTLSETAAFIKQTILDIEILFSQFAGFHKRSMSDVSFIYNNGMQIYNEDARLENKTIDSLLIEYQEKIDALKEAQIKRDKLQSRLERASKKAVGYQNKIRYLQDILFGNINQLDYNPVKTPIIDDSLSVNDTYRKWLPKRGQTKYIRINGVIHKVEFEERVTKTNTKDIVTPGYRFKSPEDEVNNKSGDFYDDDDLFVLYDDGNLSNSNSLGFKNAVAKIKPIEIQEQKRARKSRKKKVVEKPIEDISIEDLEDIASDGIEETEDNSSFIDGEDAIVSGNNNQNDESDDSTESFSTEEEVFDEEDNNDVVFDTEDTVSQDELPNGAIDKVEIVTEHSNLENMIIKNKPNNPAMSVAYVSKPYYNKNTNARDTGEAITDKSINGNKYNNETSVSVKWVQGDNPLDAEFSISFDGNTTDGAFVPTMARMLATKSQVFTTQEDGDDKHYELTNRGLELLQSLILGVENNLDSNYLIKSLAEVIYNFVKEDEANPDHEYFSNIHTRTDSKNPFFDPSFVAEQLINLYNLRVSLLNELQNNPEITISGQIVNITQGTISRSNNRESVTTLMNDDKRLSIDWVNTSKSHRVATLTVPMRNWLNGERRWTHAFLRTVPEDNALKAAIVKEWLNDKINGELFEYLTNGGKNGMFSLNNVRFHRYNNGMPYVNINNKKYTLADLNNNRIAIDDIIKEFEFNTLTSLQEGLNSYMFELNNKDNLILVNGVPPKTSVKNIIKKYTQVNLQPVTIDGDIIYHTQSTYEIEYETNVKMVERPDEVQNISPESYEIVSPKEGDNSNESGINNNQEITDDSGINSVDENLSFLSIKTTAKEIEEAPIQIMSTITVGDEVLSFEMKSELVSYLYRRALSVITKHKNKGEDVTNKVVIEDLKGFFERNKNSKNKLYGAVADDDVLFSQLITMVNDKLKQRGVKIKTNKIDDSISRFDNTDIENAKDNSVELEESKKEDRYDAQKYAINDFSRVKGNLLLTLDTITTGKMTTKGFPEYFSSNDVYLRLRQLMADKTYSTWNDFIESVKKYSDQNPTYVNVLNVLNNLNSQEKIQLLNALKLTKDKFTIPYWEYSNGIFTMETIPAMRNTGGALLSQQWNTNWLDNNSVVIDNERYIAKKWYDDTFELINNLTNIKFDRRTNDLIIEDKPISFDAFIPELVEFFDRIGVVLPEGRENEVIMSIIRNNKEYSEIANSYRFKPNENLFNISTGTFGVFNRGLNNIPKSAIKVIDGTEYVDVSKYTYYSAIDNYITNFGKYISHITGNLDSYQHININNQMQFGYSLPDHLSRKVANNFKSNNPSYFSDGNIWVGNNIELEIVDGISQKGEDNTKAADDLNSIEREVVTINSICNKKDKKRVFGPQHSDKSRIIQFLVPSLSKVDGKGSLHDDVLGKARLLMTASIGESERMRRANTNIKQSNEFDKGYQFYYTQSELNYAFAKDIISSRLDGITIEEVEGILEKIASMTVDMEYIDIEDAINNKVVELGSIEHLIMAGFIKNGSFIMPDIEFLKSPGNIEPIVDFLTDSILHNSYDINEDTGAAIIHNKNFIGSYIVIDSFNKKVFDRLQYWNNIGITSALLNSDFKEANTKNALLIAAHEVELYNKIHNDAYLQAVSGDPVASFKGGKKFNFKATAVTSEDLRAMLDATRIETVKRLAASLASGTAPTTYTIKNGKIVEEKTYNTLVFNDDVRNTTNKILEQVLPDIYKDAGIERTDAAEYGTAEEAIKWMYSVGDLSEEHFRWLMIKARAQDKLKWNEAVPEEYKFTDEELKIVFGAASKPVQIGENVISEKQKFGNKLSNVLQFYGKSAFFPIVHQTFAGTELVKIKQVIVNSSSDRAIHKSGVKRGATDIATVWDENGHVNPDLTFKDNIITLDRSSLYQQQEIPYDEQKNEILILSQMDKLITEGLSVIENHVNIIAKKEDTRKLMIQVSKKSFMKDFGITEDNGVYTVKDYSKAISQIKKSAIARGVEPNLVAALNLNENNEAIIPVFFAQNADKFESILTAIISDIAKQHTHGHSYVQMPGAGVLTLEDALNNGVANDIIYINKEASTRPPQFMTADIDEDGTIRKTYAAEVILPWKFTNKKGELLNINDFVKDGYLDADRVPEELLRLIGARIPNQGHASMLPIKIIGFLPQYYGNTMIVPAEISKQMGSDYDVDKLYTYMLNYRYTNGKLLRYSRKESTISNIRHKINRELIGDYTASEFSDLSFIDLIKRKNEIEETINKDDLKKYYKTKGFKVTNDKSTTFLNNFENEHYEYISIKNELNRLRSIISDEINMRYDELSDDKKEKGIRDLQNDYFDIHWDVLTHPEMFKRVASSIDLPDLAEEYDKLKSERDGYNYSVSDPMFNTRSYFENRAGKEGVAIEANYMVLNGMLQNMFDLHGDVHDLKLTKQLPNGNVSEFSIIMKANGKNINLNNIGRDSKSNYKNKARRIHDNIQNILSEAVDNAKYGRLGALNFNKATFSAINAMLMLSAEDNGIYTSIANDYTVAFMTHPAILDWISKSESLNHSFNITQKLTVEQLNFKNERYLRNENLKSSNSITIPDIKSLREYNNLPSHKQIEIDNQIIDAFIVFNDLGRKLSDIQKAIDTTTKGIGKSFVESSIKERMYHQHIVSNNQSDIVGLSISGIDKMRNMSYGVAVENVTIWSNNIFNELFPYRGLLSNVLDYTEGIGVRLTEDKIRTIFNNFKAFTYANDDLYEDVDRNKGTTKSSVKHERNRLLYDTFNNSGNIYEKSIFDKYNEIKDKVKGIDYLTNSLVVNTDKNGFKKFVFKADKAEKLDVGKYTEILYLMLTSKDNEIKDFANDLVTYQLLFNPVQGPNNFMRYLPVQIFTTPKINEHLNKANRSLLNKDFNWRLFKDQLIRNYSELQPISKLKVAHTGSIKVPSSEAIKHQLMIARKSRNIIDIKRLSEIESLYTQVKPYEDGDIHREPGDIPEYIQILFEDHDVVGRYGETHSEYVLYKSEKQPDGSFVLNPIDKLGQFDFREFNSSSHIESSMIPKNKLRKTNNQYSLTDNFNPDAYGLTTETTVGKVLQVVKKRGNAQQIEIASLIEPLVSKLPISIDYNLDNAGVFENERIRINPKHSNTTLSNISSSLDVNSLIIHESWHKIINDAKIIRNKDAGVAKAFAKLDALRVEYITQLSPEEKQNLADFVKALYNRNKDERLINFLETHGLSSISTDSTITQAMKSKYYGLLNVDEFVTMAWSDPDFQIELASTKIKDGTFVDRLLEVFNELLTNILNAIGMNIPTNSYLAQTLLESMNIARLYNNTLLGKQGSTPVFDTLPTKSNTKTMTYAGIGSRETPQDVLSKMHQISKRLDSLGYKLHTGFTFFDNNTKSDEEGADKAFSDGTNNKVLFGPDRIRIYNNTKSFLVKKYEESVSEMTDSVVNEIHPKPKALTSGARKLMARNANQLFGEKLDSTVDFVLFYDKSGWDGVGKRPERGGTLQAVDMAHRKGIPVINMANNGWEMKLKKIIENSDNTKSSLTPSQEEFAKKNKIEQNYYDKKPYPKEKDGKGNVIKWDVVKSKTGESSMAASLSGNRTQTTRSQTQIKILESIAKNQGLQSINGAIVWMEGQIDNKKNSTNIKGDWFKITSEPYTPNESDFNAYENWERNVWDDMKVGFKIGEEGEWKSIRFERLNKEKDVGDKYNTTPVVVSDNPTIKNIEQGSYVKYKGETYIVTQILNNDLIQIYNPELEGVNSKKSISKNNIESVLKHKAKIIYDKKTDANYIITPKKTIISTKSYKKMNWDENNGNRIRILDAAASQHVGESDKQTYKNTGDESSQSKTYSLQDLAMENKGRKVFIKYYKYKTGFEAVVTGDIMEIAGPTISIDKDGDETILNPAIYGMAFKTNTGKIVTADIYDEVKGLIGVEKMMRASDDNANQSIEDKLNSIKIDVC